eukprot:INCI7645.1.p1 GENE.INCI7645.1~~INCI7645.1.p1  ORF type:complete len:334 (+),score=57.64 INCI7645.1:101-1102(+)
MPSGSSSSSSSSDAGAAPASVSEPHVHSARAEATYRFAASSFGAMIAETLTLPTDVAKTRLQVQGKARHAAAEVGSGSVGKVRPLYTGFADCLRSIHRDEGAAALWKGLAPALIRQVCYSSLSLVLYEPVRNGYGHLFQKLGVHNDGKPTFLERLLAGGTAGALAITVFNPTEVIKTQIMTHEGKQTMRGVMKRVFQRDGISGFWAGLSPNIARTFLVNAAELGTYDEAKQLLIPHVGDNFLAFLGASAIAGLASAVVSTPSDVVKTRMMNSAGGTRAYSSMFAGVVDIARHEGPLALYKGFAPIFVRKIMWCSTFFLVYEELRMAIRNAMEP